MALRQVRPRLKSRKTSNPTLSNTALSGRNTTAQDHLRIQAEVRRVKAVPAQVVTLTRMGDVDSDRLIDGEFRQENAMEPISAAIVIVALVALSC